MTTATTRRTSVYTIRLNAEDLNAVDAIRAGLLHQGVGIADLGDASVSFRAAGDDAALRIARTAAAAVQRTMTLTTGLGVHRRLVGPRG